MVETQVGGEKTSVQRDMPFLYLCPTEEASMQYLVNNYFTEKQTGTGTETTTMVTGAGVLLLVNQFYQVPINDINNFSIKSMFGDLHYRIGSMVCPTHRNGLPHYVTIKLDIETNECFLCDDAEIREFDRERESEAFKPSVYVYHRTG